MASNQRIAFDTNQIRFADLPLRPGPAQSNRMPTSQQHPFRYLTTGSSLHAAGSGRQTPASSTTPSLTSSYLTDSSSSSISRGNQALVREGPIDEDGNLAESENSFQENGQEPSAAVFDCEMFWTSCKRKFQAHEREEWLLHGRSHLGQTAPRYVICPFAGCGATKEEDNGEAAWQWRRKHIAKKHQLGDPLKSKPDQGLLRHLHNNGKISTELYQTLTLQGSHPGRQAPALVSNNRSARRAPEGRGPRRPRQ